MGMNRTNEQSSPQNPNRTSVTMNGQEDQVFNQKFKEPGCEASYQSNKNLPPHIKQNGTFYNNDKKFFDRRMLASQKQNRHANQLAQSSMLCNENQNHRQMEKFHNENASSPPLNKQIQN